MQKWGIYALSSSLIILAMGCIEPYPPPDIGENVSILVVDGFINATDSSATVQLTKAVALSEPESYPAEKGAAVSIHSEKGDSYALIEQDSGRYSASGLPIDPSTKYQLSIHTAGNRDYISDFVSVTQTRPIDSVTWRPEEEGITILVNTHDDTDGSRYYLWDYIETWEYRAPYPSAYTNVNGQVILRKQEDIAYICYRTLQSTKITVGSTARLSADVVRDFPVTYVKATDSRVSATYSILVRQRVIEKRHYEYMQDLQRVTESVGGLFDSQPYEILGNILSADPSIPVLGYFSAGLISEQRIFVRRADLPEYLHIRQYHYCHLDTVCTFPNPTLTCITDIPSLPDYSYIVSDLSPGYPGYTMTTRACADCRAQGGVLARPDFWP